MMLDKAFNIVYRIEVGNRIMVLTSYREKYPKIMLMLYVIVLKKGIVKHSAETYSRVFDFIIAGLRVRIKIFKVRHMIGGVFQCVFHFGSVTKRI
ncbi:hypothetical protein V1477_014436 [Vespula maculifrons]|uniref:Uncharacterized protein n=1 Tax=Vespula maculifrons TaxID=7453 RepID=A0ABD2BL11_VESMC